VLLLLVLQLLLLAWAVSMNQGQISLGRTSWSLQSRWRTYHKPAVHGRNGA